MVSTYFGYSYVTRNLAQTLTRVAQQTDVSRDAAYYKANIGKVHTVDDLMNDYRLYHYVTKAYGLEDMAYAKAFMKKVLQSDLSDPKSFANTLIDKRYRDFAAAFSFGGGETKVAQSDSQTDDMIGLYTAAMKSNVDAVAADTKYYNATIGNVTSADQLLNDDRLRNYVASAFGIDQSKWPRDTIKQVLSSDPSDPNSYVNVTFSSQLNGLNAQLAQAKSDATDANSKIADYTTQLSQPGADVNQLNVQILVEKYRLQTAVSSISSTNDAIATTGQFMDLAGAFEFSADGSLPPGTPAQTAANIAITNQSFDDSKSAVYSAASPLQEALVIAQFRKVIPNVTSLQALVSTPGAYNFTLAAVGLDPTQVSQSTVKAVLESDLNDPKSYVYTLKDDRYVKLARAFNFDAKGNLTTPLVAQDSAEILDIAKNYIIAKLKTASTQDQAKVKAQAQKDATDYQQVDRRHRQRFRSAREQEDGRLHSCRQGSGPRESQHRLSQEDLRLRSERSQELRKHGERPSLCRDRGVVQFRQQGQRRASSDDGSAEARSIPGNTKELSRAKPGAAAGRYESRRAPGAVFPAQGGRHHVRLRHPCRQGSFGGVPNHLRSA